MDNLVKEVLGHLTGLDGASVRVTLELEADVPGGVPERVQLIVSENCRNLKFKEQGFEKE